jgi:general secretion pathway protein H
MRRATGFTLIEAIVVVSIIALTTTFLTLNIGAAERRDDQALERLRIALEASADQAAVRGTPVLVEFLPRGYRFSRLDIRGNWVPIEEDPVLSPQDLPVDIVWRSFEVDGQTSVLQLVLGTEMPAFELRIGTPAGETRLAGLPTGSVRRTDQQRPGT